MSFLTHVSRLKYCCLSWWFYVTTPISHHVLSIYTLVVQQYDNTFPFCEDQIKSHNVDHEMWASCWWTRPGVQLCRHFRSFCFNEWVYNNGKIITDNVSQHREKQTNQRTIHPSIRNVPIVQAVLMSNQWLGDFTRVSKLLGISYVSFCF